MNRFHDLFYICLGGGEVALVCREKLLPQLDETHDSSVAKLKLELGGVGGCLLPQDRFWSLRCNLRSL